MGYVGTSVGEPETRSPALPWTIEVGFGAGGGVEVLGFGVFVVVVGVWGFLFVLGVGLGWLVCCFFSGGQKVRTCLIKSS